MGACSSSSSSNPAVLAGTTSDNNSPKTVQVQNAPETETKSSTNGSNGVVDATTNTLIKKEEVKLTASAEAEAEPTNDTTTTSEASQTNNDGDADVDASSNNNNTNNINNTAAIAIDQTTTPQTTTIEQLTKSLEQLETGETTTVKLAEHADAKCPRYTVGCTPYECHGSMMEKDGFGKVANDDKPDVTEILKDATAFLTQYSKEYSTAYDNVEGGIDGRLKQVKEEVETTGTYVQTFDELQYGCRLAWRNSGRCIMRKVSFTLELLDCRDVKTADGMFQKILTHLEYAANDGAIKPVISVFAPKTNGKSAPVRIWNPQLIGYAAYKRPDGSVMGDPARLAITAIAVKYGWVPPPDEEKSDFDILPLVISDEETGHDKPQIFPLLPEQVLEVPIEHPEHEAFADLNLRWYALPAISNIGVDIGGVFYQSCPFNGWYAITEIARDLLDKQRYDLATAVAIACDIPQTTLNVWKDDVQLQVHRALLHSFAKHSVSVVDHHTASNSFADFYQEEIKQRGKCPADWVWLVPPAGGSMTSVFHQEMLHFIIKPQYRPVVDMWEELGISVPSPVTVETSSTSDVVQFEKEKCIYDKIIVCYGSETGTSLKYANIVGGTLGVGDNCVGPLQMNEVPSLIKLYSGSNESYLLIVVTSTFGKGCPPSGANEFLSGLSQLETPVTNFDYSILALGNSAYVNSFINFALDASEGLKKVGCVPITPIHVADELKNQDEAFCTWEEALFGGDSAALYSKSNTPQDEVEGENIASTNDSGGEKRTFVYTGSAALTKDEETIGHELDRLVEQRYKESWYSHAGTLLKSTDLFSFKATEGDDYLQSGAIQPGDHIAFFPKNQIDSVESVLRLCVIDDITKVDEYREKLMADVDMSRPLLLSTIRSFQSCINDDRAKKIVGLYLVNSESTSDDPNSTSNTNPSVESLINSLPPGSVPISWVLKSCPIMMPRFFSISSIIGSEVTVTQSAFHYSHSGKAGTTSKWLRMSLNPGDNVDLIFSTTKFHLPADETSPVIMIAAGSGIAPFRSFWLAKKLNPMHLFFGCQKESDLPFKSELDQLEKSDRLTLYPAYSRSETNAQYVQDKVAEESDLLSNLLCNSKTTIYVCGSPGKSADGVEYQGEANQNHWEGHCKLLYETSEDEERRYIPEVYGKAVHDTGPIGELWDACVAKTINIQSSLDRVGTPKERYEQGKKARSSRRSKRSTIMSMASDSKQKRLTVMSVMTKQKSSWGGLMRAALADFDEEEDQDDNSN